MSRLPGNGESERWIRLRLPNVFLSPHIGGITGDAHPHFFRLMVDELERFFQGHQTYFDLTPRSMANRRGQALDAQRLD